jgi:hypothetical protein
MDVCNFSARDNYSSTETKHPLWTNLQNLMTDKATITFEPANVPPNVRKFFISKFAANMQNMWDKKRIFNKSVDKALSVLLKLNLAPKKESRRLENLKLWLKNQEKQESMAAKHIGRNKKRTIIKKETKNLQKYEAKMEADINNQGHWHTKAEQCRSRLAKI